MHYVYIIYSQKIDRYYTGISVDPKNRLAQHKNKHYTGAYTRIANDWQMFLVIQCENRKIAERVEAHIKKMKSKIFIANLKKYPELVDKIKKRFTQGSLR